MTRVMFSSWKRISTLAPLVPLTMFSPLNITNGSIVKNTTTLHEVAWNVTLLKHNNPKCELGMMIPLMNQLNKKQT
jgi:hypothetical protein